MGDVATNKQVLVDLIAAADAGDVERIAKSYSEHFRDHTEGGSRAGGDKAAAMAAFEELQRAFSDTRHVVEDLIAEGDRVVVRLSAQGTHTGPFRGVEPSGTVVTMRTTAIYRLEEGLIVERWCDGATAVRDHLTRPDATLAPPAGCRVGQAGSPAAPGTGS